MKKTLGDFFPPEVLDKLLLSLKPGESLAVYRGQVVKFTWKK
jgi:hypothetical protein